MTIHCKFKSIGELAQMVERSLSMREVRGSMPRFSNSAFIHKPTCLPQRGTNLFDVMRNILFDVTHQANEDLLWTTYF